MEINLVILVLGIDRLLEVADLRRYLIVAEKPSLSVDVPIWLEALGKSDKERRRKQAKFCFVRPIKSNGGPKEVFTHVRRLFANFYARKSIWVLNVLIHFKL